MKPRKVELKDGISALKQIRQALGNISQEEFARRIGTTVKSVYRWERGDVKPTFNIDQIKRFQQELESIGLTFHDLPNDLGKKKKTQLSSRGKKQNNVKNSNSV